VVGFVECVPPQGKIRMQPAGISDEIE